MTTFTMQDLNNLPTTPEEDEAMEALAKLGGNVDLKEVFEKMGQDLTQTPPLYPTIHDSTGKVVASLQDAPEPQPTLADIVDNIRLPNPDAIQYTHGGTLGAPEPQPTLADIVNNICSQLQLLSTVISSSQAETKAGENSLQECVSLTLQQADWFKDMIRRELIGGGIEDLAKDAVQDIVESEVESYFENNFDPSYHFDFDDAVHDAVGDRIDDVVSDKIDDAVDSYLSNATVTITK